ncbi:hypothetical protein OTK49_03500 [Vibrio coralliirubri]|uniref:hypothetical protein n=1 Tax=Vibrio coralliirubri TaxID=1516159 RepID=UPI002284F0AB|nr:hypothetical protein [Vibrio coralliirubri]MCY9861583.1 hypothetical protein [Vibrio coralliirubri]
MATLSIPSRELIDSLTRDQLMVAEAIFETQWWSEYEAPVRCKLAAFDAMGELQSEEERRYLAYLGTAYPEKGWHDPENPNYLKYSCTSQHQQHMEDLRYAEVVKQSWQWHHIEPLPTPKWQIATNAITNALNGR